MSKNKIITIYDIANELNYSPSTISRALKNNKSIGKNTTKQIQETAKKLGYRPNSLAASLRNNKSNNIGILISKINRPFISSLISGVENSARAAGYNVLISQSNDNYKNEVANAKALYDSRICGIVASLSMETKNVDHFKQFIDQDIPVVFVDRVPPELNCYRVIIDNYSAAYKATEHLIQQGCKRIAHFAGAQHLNVYKLRKNGYIDALKAYGIIPDKELLIYMNTLSFEEGKEATAKLIDMKNPPDGIFSSNDTAAVSAIMEAKQKGIKIPEELAVIGFNDDPLALIVEPALSTVSHPAMKMGSLSTKRILEHADKKIEKGVSEISILDTEIIIRASSKRLK
ncbi:LacI family DNA-binding transcriptional regulator [Zunongwangia sp.]|uniref:LacI family DNA-binding transcriptional regulator n=1 Tax=Zunongwangia sp. TaxID=1965325 RepID=UPI003AA8727E